MTESITTTDRVEALIYRTLCFAKIELELTGEKGRLKPLFRVSGKGVVQLAGKIKAANDTYMGGRSLEENLKKLDRQIETMKQRTRGVL